MRWPKSLNKKIKTKICLAPYTTFKIGGPAKFFLEAGNLKELQDALVFARRARIKVYILGAGSNLLISDSGLGALVIKLTGHDFKGLSCRGTSVIAGSGLKLSQLIVFAKNKNLGGLEFLGAIPGTLGGALAGNAGAWAQSIGSLVDEVFVLGYDGKPELLKGKDLKFVYRRSNLTKFIIIWAVLKLRRKNGRVIMARIKKYIDQRKKSQDHCLPSAGCIFKNPGKISAGKLIDACGLKSRTKGGAVISKLHANFILNTAKAKAKDVLSLVRLMRKEVKTKFKINLEPEIKIWR